MDLPCPAVNPEGCTANADLAQADRSHRRNAAMSTGPRTEEGKAASRGSAVRHGVLAAVVVAQCEDRDAVDALCEDRFSEFGENFAAKVEIKLWS